MGNRIVETGAVREGEGMPTTNLREVIWSREWKGH